MEDTRVYGRYMLVAIPEKGKPFTVSEVVTLCQAQDERWEWQEHYQNYYQEHYDCGCDVVFFEVPEWQGPVRPRRSEKAKDIQITRH